MRDALYPNAGRNRAMPDGQDQSEPRSPLTPEEEAELKQLYEEYATTSALLRTETPGSISARNTGARLGVSGTVSNALRNRPLHPLCAPLMPRFITRATCGAYH
jgi:hypothetical protein